MEKQCSNCKEMKPITDFSFTKANKPYRSSRCKVCKSQLASLDNQKQKRAAMDAYGGNCCKCGFSDLRALSIDHIDGGGAKHRRSLGEGGCRIYRWLKREGYPEGFQVLCMNCQWIKRDEKDETGTTRVYPKAV